MNTFSTIDLSPESLCRQLLSLITDFLATSCPPDNPTTAATSGLLHTPLLGIRCTDSLHHCTAWAALGVYMIHRPPPNRHPNRKWPARSLSPHHEALVSSLRTLVHIIMLDKPSFLPELTPLAQHICETAATDSGHFICSPLRSLYEPTYGTQGS